MEKSPSRWWDWSSAILLYLIVLVSTWRLSATNWTPNLEYTRHLAALGVILGLAMGYSRFGRRVIRLLVLEYTLMLIPIQLIQIFDPEIELRERFLSLLGRWLFSLQELILGRPVNDPLFFVTLLSLTYWIIGLTAGYYLVRHANFLAAVLPAGFVLLVVHLNDHAPSQRAWMMAVYLLLSLILLGRLNFLVNKARWRVQNIHTSPEASLDLTYGALAVAAVFILAAWIGPSAIPPAPALSNAWERLSKSWRETNNRLDDAFASIKSEGNSASDFYRDQLTLGTTTPQSDDIVFTAFVPEEAKDFPRLYWRGRVYDRFENGRWETSATEYQSFSPVIDQFNHPDMEGREILPLTFRVVVRGQSILYSASPVNWVSRPSTAKLFFNEDGTKDIIALTTAPRFETGETYHSNAALNNPSVAELREAGEGYPAWVTERYLQLPDQFSPGLRALAGEIVAGKDTPYDKAAAITQYLRENIRYETEITIPLDVTDVLEYVILNSKQGFCNYSASAEVLMLRAVGVPARLAAGYAQGEPNETKDTYIVRRRDAHAWPEVYFPGFGWVEFEPTGNQDPLGRPLEAAEEPEAAAPELDPGLNPLQNPNADLAERNADEEPGLDSNFVYNRSHSIIAIAAAFGLVVAAIFLARRYSLPERLPVYLADRYTQSGTQAPRWLNRWARWSKLTSLERSFETINWSLRRMGQPQPMHITAAERAKILRGLLPSAAAHIEELAAEHQTALYTQRTGNAARARRASARIVIETWLALFRKIW